MKEVTLNIRSMQNGKETSNIYTVASMKKCRESYDFVFDSPDEKTFDAKKLRLSRTERQNSPIWFLKKVKNITVISREITERKTSPSGSIHIALRRI